MKEVRGYEECVSDGAVERCDQVTVCGGGVSTGSAHDQAFSPDVLEIKPALCPADRRVVVPLLVAGGSGRGSASAATVKKQSAKATILDTVIAERISTNQTFWLENMCTTNVWLGVPRGVREVTRASSLEQMRAALRSSPISRRTLRTTKCRPECTPGLCRKGARLDAVCCALLNPNFLHRFRQVVHRPFDFYAPGSPYRVTTQNHRHGAQK